MDLELLLIWWTVICRFLFGTFSEKLEAEIFIAQAVYGEEVWGWVAVGGILLFMFWAAALVWAINGYRKDKAD